MKAIKRKNAYGMGGTFDQPGYEYDAVNDTFKDLESGKVFSKEYVAPTSGTGTGTPTVKLETNKEVSITANGEVEITPTSGKDAMEKVTANVAVPVPVLEDNKAATIDVSQYTEPVEIEPTSGKDGMAKATVTLSNIPSGGGSVTLYAWKSDNPNQTIYTQSATPSASDPILYYNDSSNQQHRLKIETEWGVAAYDPSTNTITSDETPYIRDSQSDIEIW